MRNLLMLSVLLLSTYPVFAKEYYVAKNGSDNNRGSLNSPFLSIQKAADVAQPGDVIYIREGIYREQVTLRKSGTKGNPITFKNYRDEKVVVTGLEPVSGWKKHKGNIYKTRVNWDLGHENQVMINGETMREARWPNLSGFSMKGFQESMARVGSGSETTITDDALTQPDDFWNGATVWCRGGAFNKGGRDAWLAQTSIVTDFDAETKTLQFNPFFTSAFYEIPQKGNDYYLTGKLEILDAEGEWYLDDGQLYFMMPGGGKPSNVEVKKRLYAFDLSDRHHIKLEGITVIGAGIKMDNAHHCTLDRVDLKWLYYSKNGTKGYFSQQEKGINLTGDHNTIKNSSIAYSTGTGIKLAGNDNRIVNNEMHDFNYISSYASAINIEGRRNLISHNTIFNLGRSVMFTGGGENSIQYNKMYDFMWLSADGGATYAYGIDGASTEMHHNVVYGSKSDGLAIGIYIDNFTLNFKVHHNVVYDCYEGFRFNSPGNFHEIYNNTTYNCPRASLTFWGEPSYSKEHYGSRVFNNLFSSALWENDSWITGNNLIYKADTLFMDIAMGEFSLRPNSLAIDDGLNIKGITDGYNGQAPDVGAFEYNNAPWKAGHDFENPPNPGYSLTETMYQNRLKNAGFEYDLEHWEIVSGKATIVPVSDHDKETQKRGKYYKLGIKDGNSEVAQVITGLSPNTAYELSGWFHTDNSQTLEIGVRDFGGEPIKEEISWPKHQQKIIAFTTGKGSTTATVFIGKASTGLGFVYADDMGLIVVVAD